MCQCIPTLNISCLTINGVAIAQPECQTLPDNSLQINPYYDMSNNMSYWTYKVVSLCDANQTDFITDLYFLIYEGISSNMMTVSERILNCGRFEEVAFDFQHPSGVTPPTGFQYLHVPISGRYSLGACAIYRLNIIGDYPAVGRVIYTEFKEGSVMIYPGSYLSPSIPTDDNYK